MNALAYTNYSLKSMRRRLREAEYSRLAQEPPKALSEYRAPTGDEATWQEIDEIYHVLIGTQSRPARIADEMLVHLVNEDNILEPIVHVFTFAAPNPVNMGFFERLTQTAIMRHAKFFCCKNPGCNRPLPVLRVCNTDKLCRITYKWVTCCIHCRQIKRRHRDVHSKL